MPGKVLEVKVKAGDAVKAGDVLMILEAMKMQNEIMAPADGTISDVRISAGQTVGTGDVMIVNVIANKLRDLEKVSQLKNL